MRFVLLIYSQMHSVRFMQFSRYCGFYNLIADVFNKQPANIYVIAYVSYKYSNSLLGDQEKSSYFVNVEILFYVYWH